MVSEGQGDQNIGQRWWHRRDVWSLFVAISAVLALVIVVSVKSADALSALALALAVLAFIVQIVVLIADQQDGNRRDLEAQRVNADTRALLAQIDGRTGATEGLMREQLGKLIDRQIIENKPVPGEEPSPQQEQRFDALRLLRPADSAFYDRQEAEARALLVTSWPSETAVAQLIARGVDRLTDLAYPLLDILAMDVITAFDTATPEGRILDIPMYADAAKELIRHGYVEQNSAVLVLTNVGLQAAALINKQEDVPKYVLRQWPNLPEVRARSQH